jgi:hypothetical protein
VPGVSPQPAGECEVRAIADPKNLLKGRGKVRETINAAMTCSVVKTSQMANVCDKP